MNSTFPFHFVTKTTCDIVFFLMLRRTLYYSFKLFSGLLSNDYQLKWLNTCCISAVFIRFIDCNHCLDGFYCCRELFRWKISAKYRSFLSNAVVCFVYKFKNGPNIAICRLIKEYHLSYFIDKLLLWIWIEIKNMTLPQIVYLNCLILKRLKF